MIFPGGLATWLRVPRLYRDRVARSGCGPPLPSRFAHSRARHRGAQAHHICTETLAARHEHTTPDFSDFTRMHAHMLHDGACGHGACAHLITIHHRPRSGAHRCYPHAEASARITPRLGASAGSVTRRRACRRERRRARCSQPSGRQSRRDPRTRRRCGRGTPGCRARSG